MKGQVSDSKGCGLEDLQGASLLSELLSLSQCLKPND
ncbi:hypothetical protein NC652_039179 [Populus alba x Populus x berolinensis]|nr:hypothetical protein NC652_039179 [Populus alba x Populus x berolinensis]